MTLNRAVDDVFIFEWNHISLQCCKEWRSGRGREKEWVGAGDAVGEGVGGG